MTTNEETAALTGTADKDYNLVWFLEACLQNTLRLEQYVADATNAGDDELASLFSRAQSNSRKGAEEAKALLASRLG